MNESEFFDIIDRSKLAQHGDFLRKVARPCFDIIRFNAEPAFGASRFGGAPDLPAGQGWPVHRLGPYRFLGQINFEQITDPGTGLPENGLLSIYFADDPDGESFWQDPGYIKAVYSPKGAPLLTQNPPNPMVPDRANAIAFKKTFDLPYDREQVEDWPFDSKLDELYDKLRFSLHGSEDYLLGYPSHRTLGYDPTPSAEQISLLTLNSDDDLGWSWHDGDKLMIFIERNRLAERDFSSLSADAG